MLKFTITPIDVLFFGDAKPFNRGSSASSVFPPLPNSFASSIFAKLYHHKDISIGKGLIRAVYGPFIQKDNSLYFPAPRDLMVDGDSILRLHNMPDGNNSLIDIQNCDLENTLSTLLWLKSRSDKSIQMFEGFISLDGLKKWYRDETVQKEDLLTITDILEKEERIGIHLDKNTRTTKREDGLYRVSFIRLRKGVSFVFWIDFNIPNLNSYFKTEDELLEFYNQKPNILKLGGEGKVASYKCEKNDFERTFEDFFQQEKDCYALLFLTHGIFDNKENRSNKILDCIRGFQTGIIGNHVLAGINSRNYGIKTVRAIPAGSVVYSKEKLKFKVGFLDFNESFIGANLTLVK